MTANTIWASNIQFLNDTEEFEKGRNLILNRAQQKCADMSAQEFSVGHPGDPIPGEQLARNLTQLVSQVGSSTSFAFHSPGYVFVFSFTRQEDDLSQWRSYCPAQGGYNIGFDENAILEWVHRDRHASLKECIYSEQTFLNTVDSALEDLVNELLGTFKPGPIDTVPTRHEATIHEGIRSLTLLASTFKHEAFAAEREVRLIVNGYNKDHIGYRARSGVIMPYLRITLPHKSIHSVVVGPGPSQVLAQQGLRSLRHEHEELRDLEIFASNIPYRAV